MAQKRRPIELKFHVTQQELEAIRNKMKLLGTDCTAAYLRKMALDGYVVKLELPQLREMVSLLRRSSSSLNQLAKRVNSTDRFYQQDMEEIRETVDKLWSGVNDILTALASVQ